MGYAVSEIPLVAAGIALVSLATWVLVIDWRSRLHRSFALLMATVAATSLTHGIFPDAELAARIFAVFLVAQLFAAIEFALAFRRSYADGANLAWPAERTLRILLLAGCLVLQGNYLLQPDPFKATAPLLIFDWISPAVLAGIALVAGLHCLSFSPGQRRQALFLFAAGFALEPAFYLTTRSFSLIHMNPASLDLAKAILAATGLLAVAALVALFLRDAERNGSQERQSQGRVLLWLALASTATAILTHFARAPFSDILLAAFAGAWRLVFFGMAAYAILRHCLFTLDPRVRALVRRGGTAGVLAGVFFLVGQMLESVVQTAVGQTVWGTTLVVMGASAVVALVLLPVHRMCASFAKRFSPSKDTPEYRTRCLQIYRAALDVARRDGQIKPREIHALKQLAEALGLSPAQVARVQDEASVAAQTTGPATA